MLIVVHYRNIHFLFQTTLNFKTLRCFNIFQIDPTKSRLQRFYYFNEIINISGVQFKVKNVNIRKYFKQQTFTFHYRFTRSSSDIS
ncbi:hypothetical protein D3C78_1633130 [compost metagenome]